MNGPHFYIGGWLWFPASGFQIAELDYSNRDHGPAWVIEQLGDGWLRRN